MKRLSVLLMLLLWGLCLTAQEPVMSVSDTIARIHEVGVGQWMPAHDTIYVTKTDTVTVTLTRTDTVTKLRVDSVFIRRTDTVTVRVADTAALNALRDKEKFYREILTSNGVDKERLEAERNYYIRLVDSLRSVVRISEIEAVRREEANKYLEERARQAEEKVAQVNNRKKKVRPIQGIAMRFYRTPRWEIRLDGTEVSGQTTYTKVIRNRNTGSIEFDYITGASVMLWDLTPMFNRNHNLSTTGKLPDIKKFDQEFNYDLGLYVGFGGSNLFKNFYVGASFRFVDFFYLTTGVNIAEYEVLVGNYKSGDKIPANMSIDDLTAKAWLVKPFVALSIDLDFLSLIKR